MREQPEGRKSCAWEGLGETDFDLGWGRFGDDIWPASVEASFFTPWLLALSLQMFLADKGGLERMFSGVSRCLEGDSIRLGVGERCCEGNGKPGFSGSYS